MADPRWNKIERIFQSAAPLQGEARRRYMERACNGDVSLQMEIESLLDSSDAASSPLLRAMEHGAAAELGDRSLPSDLNPSPRDSRGDKLPMEQQARCERGHFYNPQQHLSCPHCGVAGLDIGPTMPYVPPYRPSAPPVAQDVTGPLHGQDQDATVGLYQAAIGLEPVVGWLVCVEGQDKGRDFRIRSQRNFLGRSPRMDISIPGDSQISRENHAVIIYDARSNSFRVAPGDARGMTYLNGDSVDIPTPLKAYDTLEVGDSKLLFVPLCGDHFQWN